MRIFYAICYPFVGGDWVDKNFYATLIEMKQDIVRYDWDPPFHFDYSLRWYVKDKPLMNKILIEKVQKAHKKKKIDIFFSYFHDSIVYPETIEKIGNMGMQTLNFYFDDTHQFHQVKKVAPSFHYCWTTTESAIPKYRAIGATPIYAPPAANPNVYKPYPLQREFDVTFIGQCYGERPDIIYKIQNAGFDVSVWGKGWYQDQSLLNTTSSNDPFKVIVTKYMKGNTKKDYFTILRNIKLGFYDVYSYFHHQDTHYAEIMKKLSKIAGPPLRFEDLVKMYSRSKINLGIEICGKPSWWQKWGSLTQIKLRDFEVPMSGGLYLTQYQEELEKLYDVGKEIICYHNTDDLIEKIKFYLNHPADAENVRAAGNRRARRDHTWVKRFENVFKVMGF